MTDNNNLVFPKLETDRLILKEMLIEDAASIFHIFADEEIMKDYGRFPMKSIEEAESLIAMFDENSKNGKGIRWGILLKEENKIIGTCGYHNWNKRHSRAEIGYELSKDAWRKGYIKEAVKAIIDYGYEIMDLNRIEAVVYPENEASIRSLINHGFMKEGLLEEYAFFRNVYQDLIMFSLLKKNWLKK
ncbi:GCN5-related N-acetyltransferase [Alkaliphilus metalliredigens QYMF]|uniref:GCN5-related N-acetyltransferase n=1 Tax=Alkaliphilus metalliredigens (strain QYMF) TaxID=293826 RepID=A6TTH6_ALKMQ|nr:GNAT family protein [Alkaliphilus metalliredigens]ABR49494.1 GCN5-related N-acetyltransferase [Alkaliphilus metalliredigens QYMF]